MMHQNLKSFHFDAKLFRFAFKSSGTAVAFLREMQLWEQIDINRGFDVWREIDEYEEIIRKLQREEIHPERFKSYRLNFGTYGVRGHGEGMHMQRIKVPSGFILSEQLRTVADIVEKFAGSGHGHLTTRQDIQIHYVKLEHIPTILRMLAKVGMTTREACGNTVRNITASPWTGICKDEVFDVLPYAIFCTRYFLRHPLSYTLPRKFKIAFSECPRDEAMVRMHDIGAVAVIKDGKKGFRVWAGGGLGSVPMQAILLTDFVPVEEFYTLVEAILRVFHREGERRMRNKARMKFLVAKLGEEEFKRKVFEEFELLKKVRDIRKELEEYVKNFPEPAPTKNGRADGEENEKRLKEPLYKPDMSNPRFRRFLEKYVREQRQKGYFAVLIKPQLGNLKPDEFRFIADLCEKYGAGWVKITQDQNILLPWVEEKFLYDVFQELGKAGFLNGGITEASREIVSCPGAFSCRLAVTHPYNLAQYIGKHVDDLDGIRIHISGCPNSCGQHHIADIGFYGASGKVGQKLAPYYVVLVGGQPFWEEGRYGKVIGKVPARKAHLFVKEVVELWKKERKNGETFTEFVDRVGLDTFRKILAKYAKADPSDPDIYKEPGMDEEFRMEAESRGECAGSLIDLMAINLFDAIRYTLEADDLAKIGKFEEAKKLLLDAMRKCAKMYVYLLGIEEDDPQKLFDEFVKNIVPKGWLCSDWADITQKYKEFEKLPANSENIRKISSYVSEFVKDCDKAFVRLQPNLKIEVCKKGGDSDE